MNNFYSFIKSAGLIVCFSLLTFTNVNAQSFLEIPVKLDIEKGNLDDVVVKVKKDGKDAFTQSGASKMRFKLDYGRKYTLVFTKEGYVTKTIEINTNAPAARITQGFEPYKIGVKLFKQGDENTVVYNQAVAKIKYDQMIDEFSFDTDYSKSILSAMNDTDDKKEPVPEEKKKKETPEQVIVEQDTKTAASASPKIEESKSSQAPAPVASEERQPSPLVASTDNAPIAENPKKITPVESQEEQKSQVVSAGESNQWGSKPGSGEEEIKTAAVNSGEESRKTQGGKSGADEQKKASVSADSEKHTAKIKVTESEERRPFLNKSSEGFDMQSQVAVNLENEKVTREDIVEKNRVITKVRVMKGRLTTEYSRINYSWGGQFFFKNNCTSIPENLFVQWTGVSN